MAYLLILVTGMNGGGAERIASTLQEKLSQSYSCEFVMLHQGKSYYAVPGVIRTIMDYDSSKNKLSKMIQNIIGFLRYVILLHAEKPSIVISIQAWENLWNLLSSLFSPIIPVISIHGQPHAFLGFNRYLLKFAGYLVRVLHNAKIIAVSKGVAEEYHQLCHVPYHKIKVLYNPIDVESIQSLVKSVDYPLDLFSDNVPVIITAGRLNMVKGQHHLIRAFAMLRRDRPARLLICGIGSEEAYLKTLAKDLGVENDVVFLGWQTNPYKYMAHSTVFVLSSLSESFGNVLVEAMASGCPVISANCSSGVREIIGENSEYGLLAEPMTGIRHRYDESLDSGENSLLESMRKLIDDSSLREAYIEKGRERAEFFSVERRIREYELFIQEIMVKKD